MFLANIQVFLVFHDFNSITNQDFDIKSFIEYVNKLNPAPIPRLILSPMNTNEVIKANEATNTNEKDKNFFIGEDDEQFHVLVEKIKQNQFFLYQKIIDIRNRRVMCKKVLIPEEETFKHVQNAMKEFELLLTIDHPCICKIFGVNTCEIININDDDELITTIALFLEFLDFDLKDCLTKGMLTNTIKAQIAIEIIHAMLFIHNHGLIHRDLKIDNIRLNSLLESKIADLNLVKINDLINQTVSQSQSSFVKNLGDAIYMSPELLKEEKYDNKTDVYSFGVLLYHLFEGSLPKYTIKSKLKQKEFPLPSPSDSISKFCIDLISRCISFDPKLRPSFENILEQVRLNYYGFAPDINFDFVSKRDQELSSAGK